MENLENKAIENEAVQKGECLKLQNPIKVDGKEVKEIYYDFESLTGVQMDSILREAEKETMMSDYAIVAFQANSAVQARTFAEASGLALMDVKRLGANDYMKALTLARNFFIQGSSGSQTEKN